MITEAILSVLFGIGGFLISLLPDFVFDVFQGSTNGLATVMAYALYFFPLDVWLFGLGSIVTMMGISVTYALGEWVWKKIPGVD